MALLSPGIEVVERDSSLVVPIAGSSFAVYCGQFYKGPSDVPVLITSVQELIDTFGYPTNSNANDWYQVYSFLQYSNTIYVVRVGGVTISQGSNNVQGKNAVYEIKLVAGVNSVTTATMGTNQTAGDEYIANITTYEHSAVNQTTGSLKIISKYMGLDGNNISVVFESASTFASSNIEKFFQYAPGDNELAVAVFYKDEFMESSIVSLDKTAKDFNNKSLYIEDVINRQSQYIYISNEATAVTDIVTTANVKYTLIDGTDSVATTGDIANAYYNNFENKEIIDIDIVIIPEDNYDVAQFCLDRSDVIGYVGAGYDKVVGIVSSQAVSNLNADIVKWTDNKYISYIGNYAYIYDRYTDKYRWINLAGATAGLRAATNNNRYPWFASAGLNQGRYKGIRKFAQNFTQGQRDLLYKNAINSAVTFPNQGNVLWGQKVATIKPSALDRVNVRMLFNYAERAITKMSKYVLFEQNTDTTRNLFVSTVKPFFDRIKATQGLEDFMIVCDTTNNTAIVRQNNQFVADFYLKPAYAIEFITLRFTAVGASVSFSDVVSA